MIYVVKKHSRKHIFPGDIDKQILQYYRDRKWRITLDMTRSVTRLEKAKPGPAPREKPERRKPAFVTILGRRILVD